jgi:hypothetical protein
LNDSIYMPIHIVNLSLLLGVAIVKECRILL